MIIKEVKTVTGYSIELSKGEALAIINTVDRLDTLIAGMDTLRKEFGDDQANEELGVLYNLSENLGRIFKVVE